MRPPPLRTTGECRFCDHLPALAGTSTGRFTREREDHGAPMRIRTNIPTLAAQRQLSRISTELAGVNNSLSSGKRINRASDDAAGLFIADDQAAIVRIEQQARRNIGDGQSAAAIAEGVVQTVAYIREEQAGLAAQAANETLSAPERESINRQYQALEEEVGRITASAEFNGQPLFTSGGTSFDVQVGTDGSGASRIAVSLPSLTSGAPSALTDAASSRIALDRARADVAATSQALGQFGQFSSRLSVADENLAISSVNRKSAESQLRDADVAEVAARRTGLLIGQQSAISVLAQANQQPSAVLRLLRG